MDINLDRFLEAQEGQYDSILAELRNGQKRAHWMWYVFPQTEGLGRSDAARFYAIKGLNEAQAYLDHATLGARLRESTKTTLKVHDRTLHEIFASPDD